MSLPKTYTPDNDKPVQFQMESKVWETRSNDLQNFEI